MIIVYWLHNIPRGCLFVVNLFIRFINLATKDEASIDIKWTIAIIGLEIVSILIPDNWSCPPLKIGKTTQGICDNNHVTGKQMYAYVDMYVWMYLKYEKTKCLVKCLPMIKVIMIVQRCTVFVKKIIKNKVYRLWKHRVEHRNVWWSHSFVWDWCVILSKFLRGCE